MKRNETFKNGKRYENKDCYLALERKLGWVKWLKNELGQSFISLAIIPAVYPLFNENFIG